MGKYSPLKKYLDKQDRPKIQMSFSEVEEIISDKLPISAYKYQAWWSNGGHNHANAWLNVNFTASVDLDRKIVIFAKNTKREIHNSFSYSKRIQEFNQRWHLSSNLNRQNKITNFKNRFQNIIGLRQIRIGVVTDFCNMAGVILPLSDSYFLEIEKFVCKVFRETKDFRDYIKRVQILFWALEKSQEIDKINSFYEDFCEILEMSPSIGISAQKINNQVVLYPSGAKLLDEKIINMDLLWLSDFPEVQELFEKSLADFLNFSGEKAEARSILDGLRTSLEVLLKDILNNDKPLEKNAKEIKLWLKTKNVHPNIRNSVGIFTHLENYIRFMNDVKHPNQDINYSKNEIEHMIYQTGIFIRLIIETEKS